MDQFLMKLEPFYQVGAIYGSWSHFIAWLADEHPNREIGHFLIDDF